MLRRKIVVLCLMLALAVSALCGAFAEGDSGTANVNAVQSVAIPYSSYTGFAYNDDMLFVNANALSTDLAKASVVLATMAYDGEDGSYIRGILSEKMGYRVVGGADSYARQITISDNDRVAYTIGVREVNGYSVYCVPICGTRGNAEWISDFNLGENNGGNHAGFYTAANYVLDDLKRCFAADGKSASNRIVWVMGHSRGGAVANIVAGKLSEGGQASTDHIFGYTFGCPAVSKHVQAFDNIYNFNNAGDPVAAFPLEDWGYGRYGQTITMNLRTMINVKQVFKRVMGHDFSSAAQTDDFVSAFKKLVPSEEAYHQMPQKLGFLLAGYIMDVGGGGGDITLAEIIQKAGIELPGVVQAVVSYYEQDLKKYIGMAMNLNDTIDTMLNIFFQNPGLVIQMPENEDSADYIKYGISVVHGLLDMYLDKNGNPLRRVSDGHTPATYVAWINSMYCGYKGWYESSADMVNIQQYTDHGAQITRIGPYCFYNCDGLYGIGLPDGLVEIGESAFDNCDKLTTLEIPKSVVSLGAHCLPGTLRRLTIPFVGANRDARETPDAIMRYLFGASGDEQTSDYHYADTQTSAYYSCASLESVTITDATVIPNSAFRDLSGLNRVTLNDGITAIHKNAFAGCAALSGLKLPETVTQIDAGAFSDCGRLTGKIEIPAAVTTLSDSAFSGCGATVLSFKGDAPSIAEDCFQSVTALACYPSGNATWTEERFKNYGGTLTWIPADLKISPDRQMYTLYLSDLSFGADTQIGVVVQPEVSGTLPIEWSSTDSSIVNVVEGRLVGLREGMAFVSGKLGDFASFNCIVAVQSLPSAVKLPSGLKTIEDEAFAGMSAIQAFGLPEGVESVGAGAFADCGELRIINLPDSVKDIAATAFDGCDNLLIYGTSGSAAEQFATEHGISFELMAK